jgi:hypothetical protein
MKNVPIFRSMNLITLFVQTKHFFNFRFTQYFSVSAYCHPLIPHNDMPIHNSQMIALTILVVVFRSPSYIKEIYGKYLFGVISSSPITQSDYIDLLA